MTGSTNADLESAAAAAAAEMAQHGYPSHTVHEGSTGGATPDTLTTAMAAMGKAASAVAASGVAGDGSRSVAEAAIVAAAEPDLDAAQEVLPVESPAGSGPTQDLAAGILPSPEQTREASKQVTTDEVPLVTVDVTGQDVVPEQIATAASAGSLPPNAAESVPPSAGSTAPVPVGSNATMFPDETPALEHGSIADASNDRVEGGLTSSRQNSAGPEMNNLQPLSPAPSSHLSAAGSRPLEDHVPDGGKLQAEASGAITQAQDQSLTRGEAADRGETVSDQVPPDNCRGSGEGHDDGSQKGFLLLHDSRGEDNTEVGGTPGEATSDLIPDDDDDDDTAAVDTCATCGATDDTVQGVTAVVPRAPLTQVQRVTWQRTTRSRLQSIRLPLLKTPARTQPR